MHIDVLSCNRMVCNICYSAACLAFTRDMKSDRLATTDKDSIIDVLISLLKIDILSDEVKKVLNETISAIYPFLNLVKSANSASILSCQSYTR